MGGPGGWAKPPCKLLQFSDFRVQKSCIFMSKLPSPVATMSNEERIYEQELFSKFLSKAILRKMLNNAGERSEPRKFCIFNHQMWGKGKIRTLLLFLLPILGGGGGRTSLPPPSESATERGIS